MTLQFYTFYSDSVYPLYLIVVILLVICIKLCSLFLAQEQLWKEARVTHTRGMLGNTSMLSTKFKGYKFTHLGIESSVCNSRHTLIRGRSWKISGRSRFLRRLHHVAGWLVFKLHKNLAHPREISWLSWLGALNHNYRRFLFLLLFALLLYNWNFPRYKFSNRLPVTLICL